MLTNLALNIGTPWPETSAPPAPPSGGGATEFAATMLNLTAVQQTQPSAAAPEPVQAAKPMVASLPADVLAALSDASLERAAAAPAAAVPLDLQGAAPEPMPVAKPMVASLPADAPAALSDASIGHAATASAAAVPPDLQGAAPEPMRVAKPIVASSPADTLAALSDASLERAAAAPAAAVPLDLQGAAPEPMPVAKPMVASLPADAPAALSVASLESADVATVASVPHDLRIDSGAATSQGDDTESEVEIMASLVADIATAAGPADVASGPQILPSAVAADAMPEMDTVNEAQSAAPSVHLHASSAGWTPTVAKNSNFKANEVPSAVTAGIVHAPDALFGADHDMTKNVEVAARSEPSLAFSFTASPVAANVSGAAIMQPSLTPERQLDLTNDARWLGELANDIALASSDEGILNFRMLPKQLGRIEVSIEPGATGLIIQVATETEAARAMLVAASPRLLSELGQSGVSVENATYGNLGQQDAGGGQPRREQQNAPPSHPFVTQPTRPRPSERGTSVPSRVGRFA
jgi:flagellar hook-length control protein FliK